MFNNFTCEKEYECCNVIIESCENRGALLIGDFNAATDQQIMRKYSIKTVITAAAGMDHLKIPGSVTHITYPLLDAKTQNIKSYFDQCFLTIDRKLNQGGVLIHCAAGVSRSATLTIAYIMKKNQISFKQAIALVRSKRAGVCPNLGFQMQLKKYQSQVLTNHPLPPKLMKKNVSENLNQQTRKQYQFKKLQNSNFLQFQPVHSHMKKSEIKKGIPRHIGYSKPREKPMFEVMQTELFISGKSAKRPSSQARQEDQKNKTGRKDPLMGTWGPMLHKAKRVQL